MVPPTVTRRRTLRGVRTVEDGRDLAQLQTHGIVLRRTSELEGRQWRKRVMSHAHRAGLAVYSGQTGPHAWVALSGEATRYRGW
jgi:hypothetical protein